MKFCVERAGAMHSRLGLLIDLVIKTDALTYQTPFCMLYTKSGCVPHLTHEVLQFLTANALPMLFPLPNIVELKGVVSAFGHNLGKFVGLEEYPRYISVQDPATVTPSGYNDKNGISVWKHSGREHLDVKAFMNIQETFRPHWYQALCDSDIPPNCSKKRLSHSVQRSLSFLDKCLEFHHSSSKLKSSAIFGTIEGGYDIKAREFSARETALRPVDGFVIDGFHQNGAESENINMLEVKPILENVIRHLPESKPRIMFGAFRPLTIIEAVLCGIDIFDTSYAYLTSEKGKALLFPLTWKDSNLARFNNETDALVSELDLNDQQYQDDFRPLLENCECYSCRNFTRAYIHHLLSTSELLAPVLLMLHNMHHFLAFFSAVRYAIEEENLETYKKVLQTVYR